MWRGKMYSDCMVRIGCCCMTKAPQQVEYVDPHESQWFLRSQCGCAFYKIKEKKVAYSRAESDVSTNSNL